LRSRLPRLCSQLPSKRTGHIALCGRASAAVRAASSRNRPCGAGAYHPERGFSHPAPREAGKPGVRHARPAAQQLSGAIEVIAAMNSLGRQPAERRNSAGAILQKRGDRRNAGLPRSCLRGPRGRRLRERRHAKDLGRAGRRRQPISKAGLRAASSFQYRSGWAALGLADRRPEGGGKTFLLLWTEQAGDRQAPPA
jgi:hypothetical protein